MASKTIAIPGGGVAGVVAANELRKRLGKEHRIVLIDKESSHVFWPSLLWLQVGLRETNHITRDLDLLRKKGIEVVRGQVNTIDAERRKLEVGGKELSADYLIISLGAQLAPEKVLGLAEAGYNLYSVTGAEAIRDNRKRLERGHLLILVAATPFKCPAAPYEAALLLDHDFRKRKLRDSISLSLYTPEPGPMPLMGPDISAEVRRMIESRGIAYFPQHQVTEVNASSKTVRFANGAQASYDFLVYVPPHVAPAVVQKAGLTNERGWIPVDPHTMETKFGDVYAIGDVTVIPLPIGLPLPKAGVFAHREAKAVAQTIAAKIAGSGQGGSFDGHGECFIEVGGGKAALGNGDFYAVPRPLIKLHRPARYWHLGKVIFEKGWFRRWF